MSPAAAGGATTRGAHERGIVFGALHRHRHPVRGRSDDPFGVLLTRDPPIASVIGSP